VQGRWVHAFGYPNRPPAASIGPQVNEAARTYWGPVRHDSEGVYYFELSAEGQRNPLEALNRLFVLQRDPTKRTLIHCDYLTSVLHMRAFAEQLGAEEFQRRVASGKIPLVLRWNGFTDIIARGIATTEATSLQYVTVNQRQDLIIGDHVIFHNHPMYDVLNTVAGGVWRLENAILVDRRQGVDLFQGHGYTTPVTEAHMKRSMMRHVQRHVGNALRLTRRIDRARTAAARASAEADLHAAFGTVVQQDGGQWYVRGTAFYGIAVDTPLRMPTLDELPGLFDPRDPSKLFPVMRPVESR
jgi:hypothetical protein